MKIFKQITLTLLIAIGCLGILPSPAQAFNIWNESSVPINAKVITPERGKSWEDFKEKISPKDHRGCNWKEKSCNPSGKRDQLLQVWMETDDDFLCILNLQAGGYALFEEVTSEYINTKEFKCSTYKYDKTKIAEVPYGVGRNGNRDIHFLVTADPQYDNSNPTRNNVASNTTKEMKKRLNSTEDIRGIIVAGDLTQNAIAGKWVIPGTNEFKDYTDSISGQVRLFLDGVGNHDLESTGLTSHPNKLLKELEDRKRQVHVYKSSSKEHYSWDWDDVHFVQLNLFPGDEPAPQFLQLDPHNSLSFLKQDLSDKVGSSGRPVVLISHYGFDPFSLNTSGNEEWWTEKQREKFWDAIADYNTVAIFTGHLHPEPEREWKYPFKRPNSKSNGPEEIPAFVAGATLKGAFLDVTVKGDKMNIERWGIQPGESQAQKYDTKSVPLK